MSKYKLLRRFCGRPTIPIYDNLPRSVNLFKCGVPYYEALGTKDFDQFCITYGDTMMVMFTVNCRDNIRKWRDKVDRITREADWEIIRK
jgi:hypothetical protein